MTTHVVLDRALNPSFQLSINPSNQIVAIPRRKSCCTKLDQVKKEREAVEAATRWLSSHSPTDTNSYQAFRGIYKKASQHRIAIHRLTHGFIGWLKSLFRGKEKTEALRKLEASLIEMQKTMRIGNHLSRSITSQIEASDRSITSDMLFKQVEAEMPEAVVSPKAQVTAATFGLTEQNSTPAMPFLIQRNQSGYNFIFPPDNYQSALTIYHCNSLLDLPRLVREQQSQRILQACNSSHVSLDQLQRYPRSRINNLNLELSLPTTYQADYRLIASYRNPVNGRIETKELILDATQTEDSVKSWATELIRENQARLAEIDALLENNNPDGIQADFQTCKYYVSIDLGKGVERFESSGLQQVHFEQLKTAIASRRHEIETATTTKRANQEFFDSNRNENGEILKTVGPYEFTVQYKYMGFVNESLHYDYIINLQKVNGKPVAQELCKIGSRNLEAVLEETIESYNRYHTACQGLTVNLDKLEEALNNGDNLQLGSCLLQSVALTVERGSTDLLKAHRWVPGDKGFIVDELRVEPTTSMEQIRKWVEDLIADTKRRYDNLISPVTKDPSLSNICVKTNTRSLQIECDYRDFTFLPCLTAETADKLPSRIEKCKKNVDFFNNQPKDAEGCARIKFTNVDGKVNNDWEISIEPQQRKAFKVTLKHTFIEAGQTISRDIDSSSVLLNGAIHNDLEKKIEQLKGKIK